MSYDAWKANDASSEWRDGAEQGEEPLDPHSDCTAAAGCCVCFPAAAVKPGLVKVALRDGEERAA